MSKWRSSLRAEKDMVGGLRCEHNGYKEMSRGELFSVSVYYMFLCSIFFCMYKFDSDHFSSSLGSI